MRVNTALANPDRDGRKGPRFDPLLPRSDRTSSGGVPFYSRAPDARPIVKISCPACAAKYSIADEKVSDRLAKIRCRKCNATIVIDGKARSEEHTSELQSQSNLVCRLLLEKKKLYTQWTGQSDFSDHRC